MVDYEAIDKMIVGKKEEKKEEKPIENDSIDDILKNIDLKMVDDTEDTLGKDLQMIVKEYTADRNIMRFGYMEKRTIGHRSLLGAIADRPYYPTDVKPRYACCKSFLLNLAMNESAVKGVFADRFKDIAGSLMAFKSALEYRASGIGMGMEDSEKKHSLLDKIKKS